MAKALQCPDCGNRHPLDTVGGGRTFRCESCRRLLKVPKSLQGEVSGNGAGPEDAVTQVLDREGSASPSGARTKVPPSQRGDAVAEQRRAATSPPTTRAGRADRTATPAPPAATGARAGSAAVPRSARVALWIVAVPAGLLPVLLAGRLTGALTLDAAADVFVGVGWQRFVPVLVILPLWSAVSATLAHLAIEGLGRLLRR